LRIHYVEDTNCTIAYFPDTLRFFEINERTKGVIDAYLNSEDENIIAKKFNISLYDYNSFIDKLKECSVDENKKLINMSNITGEKILGKLVLSVSNKCNLRCKYCYANGGIYNSNEGLISIDILKRALDVFYNKFDKIKVIQIFGGEPTLNIPAIEYICKYVKAKYNNGEISELPNIGVVSNGTIVTDEIIELIKKYHIKVTVSFDGQPIVNDEMRVFPDGTGTSDIIIKNIRRLKEETGEPNTIEATYNKYHLLNNISILDIINFINTNFANIAIHIAPAGGSSECDFVLDNRNAFINSVDDIFRSIAEGNPVTYSLVQRIINAFNTKKYSSYICEAGIGSLSVSTQGDIYPCFIFTDDEDLQIGNVFDENIFSSDKYIDCLKQFISFDKFKNKKCKNCFINTLCSGCLGMDYRETGKMFELSEVTCDMFKKMVEKVIVNLLILKKNALKQ
jgi:uncharacterized protein